MAVTFLIMGVFWNTLQSASKCYCAVLFIIKERHSSTSKHSGAYFWTRPIILSVRVVSSTKRGFSTLPLSGRPRVLDFSTRTATNWPTSRRRTTERWRWSMLAVTAMSLASAVAKSASRSVCRSSRLARARSVGLTLTVFQNSALCTDLYRPLQTVL